MKTKNMRYLIIIALLVVAFAGISLYLNSVNSNENKHFEGSGVSFDYPKGWSFGGHTNTTISAQKNDPMASLNMRLHFKAPTTLESSRTVALYEASKMKAKVLIDKNITIDGEKGNFIAVKSNDGFEYAFITFFKNGKEYDFVFASKNIQKIQSDINTITSSFHVKTKTGFWDNLISFFRGN